MATGTQPGMIPLDPQEPLAGGRTDGVPLATGVLQHRASGLPMAGARVEALGAGREPIAVATTDSGGQFALYPSDTPAARLRLCMFESDPDERITVRALDRDGSAVASIEGFDPRGRERFVTLSMDSVKAPEEDWFVPLADYIQSSRRARVSDLAADLSSARPDSPVRLLSLTARAAILDRLVSTLALNREGHETELLFDDRFVNPKELRDAKIVLERPPADPSLWTRDEAAAIQWPIFDGFEWTRPDDESYRDYLRGVFVLYAHQQAIGLSGNVTQWTSVIERQLRNRFFQDFRTQDRTQVSLNKLLIPHRPHDSHDATGGKRSGTRVWCESRHGSGTGLDVRSRVPRRAARSCTGHGWRICESLPLAARRSRYCQQLARAPQHLHAQTRAQ